MSREGAPRRRQVSAAATAGDTMQDWNSTSSDKEHQAYKLLEEALLLNGDNIHGRSELSHQAFELAAEARQLAERRRSMKSDEFQTSVSESESDDMATTYVMDIADGVIGEAVSNDEYYDHVYYDGFDDHSVDRSAGTISNFVNTIDEWASPLSEQCWSTMLGQKFQPCCGLGGAEEKSVAATTANNTVSTRGSDESEQHAASITSVEAPAATHQHGLSGYMCFGNDREEPIPSEPAKGRKGVFWFLPRKKQKPVHEKKNRQEHGKTSQKPEKTWRHPERVASSSSKSNWKAVEDPITGRTYYYHRVTRETKWELEEEDDNWSASSPPTQIFARLALNEDQLQSSMADESEFASYVSDKPPKPTWGVSSRVRNGKRLTYYYNRITRATTWTKPENYDEEKRAYDSAMERYTRNFKPKAKSPSKSSPAPASSAPAADDQAPPGRTMVRLLLKNGDRAEVVRVFSSNAHRLIEQASVATPIPVPRKQQQQQSQQQQNDDDNNDDDDQNQKLRRHRPHLNARNVNRKSRSFRSLFNRGQSPGEQMLKRGPVRLNSMPPKDNRRRLV